jgi:thymidylate synthase
MLQYQNLIREIKQYGVRTPNRTGVDTLKLDGAMMRFDLEKDGFPAVTSKKLAFKSVIGELCAFLRASRSAADFRALGCKVWDANANQDNEDGSKNPWLDNPFREGEDDLGPVYGVQWREWPGFKLVDLAPMMNQLADPEGYQRYIAKVAKLKAEGWTEIGSTRPKLGSYASAIYFKEFDQLGDCVRKIIKDPNNRRILFHGWNPAALDEVALPACHLLYQFLPDSVNGRLNMIAYVRSNDVGLGTPFNVAECGALISVVARLTGLKPGRITYFTGDAHIYVNQLDYLDELLTKEPLPLPTLKINDRVPSFRDLLDPHDPIGLDLAIDAVVGWLKLIEPSDFELVNYQHHTLVTPVPKMVV